VTLLLDTSIVIDVLREDKPHYRLRLQEAIGSGRQLVISSFVLHELTYGAMISKKPEMELALIDKFVERAHVEAWSAEDAISTARLRADLKKDGLPIGAVDALIAGQALNRGWSLVTANIREFIRVDGLTVIDWSDPAGSREIDRVSWALEMYSKSKERK
jgi:tRNA(fMet)-specific endonuclease VapC